MHILHRTVFFGLCRHSLNLRRVVWQKAQQSDGVAQRSEPMRAVSMNLRNNIEDETGAGKDEEPNSRRLAPG